MYVYVRCLGLADLIDMAVRHLSAALPADVCLPITNHAIPVQASTAAPYFLDSGQAEALLAAKDVEPTSSSSSSGARGHCQGQSQGMVSAPKLFAESVCPICLLNWTESDFASHQIYHLSCGVRSFLYKLDFTFKSINQSTLNHYMNASISYHSPVSKDFDVKTFNFHGCYHRWDSFIDHWDLRLDLMFKSSRKNAYFTKNIQNPRKTKKAKREDKFDHSWSGYF